MSELGGDAKIPDLCQMSGPVDTCLKNVKEQMMMRLDEINESHEDLKAKVVSYTTNKTEQARGGQKEMHVPMQVDYVSGSEPEEEDVEDVDEIRTGSTCYIYGMKMHLVRTALLKNGFCS